MARLPQPGKIAVVNSWIVRNEGGGYGTRARRIDASPVTNVVVVEWTHPNYGYWSDAGVFVKLAHDRAWQPTGTVSWFDFADKNDFLVQYPEFTVLFHDRTQLGEPVQLPQTSPGDLGT